MNTLRTLSFLTLILLGFTRARAADSGLAAIATNEVGVDLYRKLATREENLCLSPYSIENALAMTFAGADGRTRDEMAHVLHFSTNDDTLHGSFGALQHQLEDMSTQSAKRLAESKKVGGPQQPIIITIANRLFAQKGYDFRAAFLALARERYGAPLEPVDFGKDAGGATQRINAWVLEQTRNRIRDLIPSGALNPSTRLALVNAIYLKAPWAKPFLKGSTAPQPFHVRGGEAVNVPTMNGLSYCGYAKRDGFTAVSLPYNDRDLQFLILLPDDAKGLPALEKKITTALLAHCAKLEMQDVNLHLPKFKFEPPTLNLGAALQALGMQTAFDQPRGSANFDRLAPRKPDDYLYISAVFHKTFIAVDEEGTEAAAATAVAMAAGAAAGQKPEPLKVKIDRPFFYAIQHVPSGACLFIGRVTDPR
ncbi:MAG TPA: serpin family protein [Chthoniobacterales bacterium]